MGENTSGKLAAVMPFGGEDGAVVGGVPAAFPTAARGEVMGVVNRFLGDVVGIAMGLICGDEAPGGGSVLDNGDRIVSSFTTAAGWYTFTNTTTATA